MSSHTHKDDPTLLRKSCLIDGGCYQMASVKTTAGLTSADGGAVGHVPYMSPEIHAVIEAS
ncbi:hypothetical protein GCM10011415_37280 [Salipiger pallidus]|uniref:Uncharacterized protein n=1 Tax=Salipiger pallidus TaxID=1775170 RepID=A0A8J2ZNB1_9RHOB|nr:hypothetical protein [Salipiger pallidus]GGG83814.1 hypothetical protein GCM10011415_37280 [Salipiger pallidus]